MLSKPSLRTTLPLLFGFAVSSLAFTAFSPRPADAQATDPFYQRLYEDASRSAASGRYDAAAKDFRLACFGMLTETVRLGDCLARLAIAQGESGQSQALVTTVERLVELEQRFQGYSRSSLPRTARRQLEKHLEQSVPLETIAGVAAFEEVAVRRKVTQIKTAPAEQKAQLLSEEMRRDPGNPTWQILQGELMLAQGQVTEAAEIADRLATTRPGDSRAACLRGRSQAALGACSPRTFEDMRRCADNGENVAGEEQSHRLGCQIKAADWQAAVATYDAMSSAEQNRRQHKEWAKTARRALRNVPDPADEAPETETEAPAEAVSSSSAGEPGPGSVELDVLNAGWNVLRSDARDRFEDTYDSVRALADRYPQWAEAQHVVAELAYRLSLWPEAVRYFQRADEIVSQKPDLQFYLAVALYKSGDRKAAAAILDKCEPLIEPSDFVKFWVERIRAAES